MTDFKNELDSKQFEVVTTTDGPLLVFAGAGSGKTRTIIYRTAFLIQNMGIKPWRILIVTFTNKAANELKERLNKHFGIDPQQCWVGTFHSVCARILRTEASNNLLPPFTGSFSIFDTDDQKSVFRKIYKEYNICAKTFPISKVLGIISRTKNNLISPENFFEYNQQNIYTKTVQKIFTVYRQKMEEYNAIDFDDLLVFTAEILNDNLEVRNKYCNKFDYLMIDEYQDTNYAQFKIVQLLTASHNNICVVGDDDQAIYSWRGASIKNILDFHNDFHNAKTIKLEQNYRSTQAILDIANKLIENNTTRHSKTLWTQKNTNENPIIQIYERDIDEANYVVRQITDLWKTISPDESIAILYRTNAQSRLFEIACIEQKIPYKVHGAVNFFSRKEIKDIIAYLRILVNPNDTESLLRVINFPPRGIGNTTVNKLISLSMQKGITLLEALSVGHSILPKKSAKSVSYFTTLYQDMLAKSQKESLHDLIKYLYDEIDLIPFYRNSSDQKDTSRLENIEQFLVAAEEFAENYYKDTGEVGTLVEFLQNISLYTNMDSDSEDPETPRNKINLMTIHYAKGLEFDNVFIVGLEEKLLPHLLSVDLIEDIEEERRLLYVAITRAIERVFFSYARYRRTYTGGYEDTIPSRFIYELFPEFKTSQRSFLTNPKANFLPAKKNTTNKEKEQKATYHIGQKVTHKDFGVGIILNVDGKGDKTKLTVNFSGIGLKKIIASFVQILTLEER